MTGLMEVRRLRPGERGMARRLFVMMDDVFDTPSEELSDEYVDALLGDPSFWAIAALRRGEVVGGVTAHTLPMTRAQTSEVFLYDVAVREDHRRQGIGRRMIEALRAGAAEAGVETLFVPAENEDEEALEFYRAIGGDPMAVTMFTFDQRPAPPTH